MEKSIKKSKMLEQKDMVKAQLDKTAYETLFTNANDPPNVNQEKKWTKQERVK